MSRPSPARHWLSLLRRGGVVSRPTAGHAIAPASTLSLSARVSLGVISLLVVGGILTSLAAFAYGRQAAREAYDRLLLGAANDIAASVIVVDGALSVDLPISAFQLLALAPEDRIAYRISGIDGARLTGYELDLPPRRTTPRPTFMDAEFAHEPARFVAVSKRFSERDLAGTVEIVVGQTLRARNALALDITRNALIALGLAGVLMLILAALMVRHAMQPLEAIASAFATRDPHDLTPMTTPVPREAVVMMQAMNGFMARLDRQIGAMRNLISDTAHQLRTPVAALRAQADLAAEERDPDRRALIVDRIHRRSLSLGRLLDQMLSRALVIHRTDSIRPTPIDLREIALDILDAGDHALLAPTAELKLKIDDLPVMVLADEVSLSEAAKNLVSNALKHGRAPVTLGASFEPDATDATQVTATLWVHDEGDGPSDEVLALLGQRFARTAASRGESAGLGLSIGHAVAQAFGGTLTFERPPSGGFRASLRLPPAKIDAALDANEATPPRHQTGGL
ncbi:sensor histidine kinase [Albirhodobacter sp. R86504]|uniref:sensor histidine kinase n=1 Tax=Albirhodobacter sp. R86504 TaxID=3093848 RepID=UPI00366B6D63